MKEKNIKLLEKLISGGMFLLGFSSCAHKATELNRMDKGIRVLYGIPTATYKVSGKVVDESGKPVAGIGVYPRLNVDGQNVLDLGEGAVTDSKGRFEIEEKSSAFGKEQMYVVFRDTDGAEGGGEFSADSVDVELKHKADGKEGPLDKGTYTAKVVKYVMKKK